MNLRSKVLILMSRRHLSSRRGLTWFLRSKCKWKTKTMRKDTPWTSHCLLMRGVGSDRWEMVRPKTMKEVRLQQRLNPVNRKKLGRSWRTWTRFLVSFWYRTYYGTSIWSCTTSARLRMKCERVVSTKMTSAGSSTNCSMKSRSNTRIKLENGSSLHCPRSMTYRLLKKK